MLRRKKGIGTGESGLPYKFIKHRTGVEILKHNRRDAEYRRPIHLAELLKYLTRPSAHCPATGFPVLRCLSRCRVGNNHRLMAKQLAICPAFFDEFDPGAKVVFEFVLVLHPSINLEKKRKIVFLRFLVSQNRARHQESPRIDQRLLIRVEASRSCCKLIYWFSR